MFDQEEKNEGDERQDRQATFFRFEDLRVYHKSLEYVNWLHDVSMMFPDEEKTQLIQRWNQSARNITLYIAEGSSRNKSQFIYYLKMAKSCIRECLVFGSIAFKSNNLSDSHEIESRGQLMEMTKMIGALISSLQRSQSNHNNYGDPSQNSRSRGDYYLPQSEANPNDLMSDY